MEARFLDEWVSDFVFGAKDSLAERNGYIGHEVRGGRLVELVGHRRTDVPFEFVGEIARSSAVAEAGDVKSCST